MPETLKEAKEQIQYSNAADLVYCDDEIAYYDFHDGEFLYSETDNVLTSDHDLDELILLDNDRNWIVDDFAVNNLYIEFPDDNLLEDILLRYITNYKQDNFYIDNNFINENIDLINNLKETKKDNLYSNLNQVKKLFSDIMEKSGFSIVDNNETKRPYEKVAFSGNDKYVPLFKLCIWDIPKSINLIVEDRNGSESLKAKMVAIYSLQLNNDELKVNDIPNIFKNILNDAIQKYGHYCEDNKLLFPINQIATNIEWDKEKNALDNEKLDAEDENEICSML